MSSELPPAPFPILTSVKEVRNWRTEQQAKGLSVGFVPTMGALHEGHLSLVEASLQACDCTIVSIFVNPAQFAPHEDLATYPRTLKTDIEKLASVSYDTTSTTLIPSAPSTSKCTSRTVSALFLPPVEALYPSGITTEVSKQRGTFIEVKGLQEVMEGVSRPQFFRGVATVVLKLFNLVLPTRAYFGQKDIQQALLLRRMCLDLHLIFPLPENLIIMQTFRDIETNLALSSRNAYLKPAEKPWATVLIDALHAGEQVYRRQRDQGEGIVDVSSVLKAARESVAAVEKKASQQTGENSVEIKLLYITLNDPEELWDLEQEEHVSQGRLLRGKGAILSGAVMLGQTRLIDNLVFDYKLNQ